MSAVCYKLKICGRVGIHIFIYFLKLMKKARKSICKNRLLHYLFVMNVKNSFLGVKFFIRLRINRKNKNYFNNVSYLETLKT